MAFPSYFWPQSDLTTTTLEPQPYAPRQKTTGVRDGITFSCSSKSRVTLWKTLRDGSSTINPASLQEFRAQSLLFKSSDMLVLNGVTDRSGSSIISSSVATRSASGDGTHAAWPLRRVSSMARRKGRSKSRASFRLGWVHLRMPVEVMLVHVTLSRRRTSTIFSAR